MDKPRPLTAPAPAKAAGENPLYMLEILHYDHDLGGWHTDVVHAGLCLEEAEKEFSEVLAIKHKRPKQLHIRQRTTPRLELADRPGLSPEARVWLRNNPPIWNYAQPIRSVTVTP